MADRPIAELNSGTREPVILRPHKVVLLLTFENLCCHTNVRLCVLFFAFDKMADVHRLLNYLTFDQRIDYLLQRIRRKRSEFNLR